MAMSNNLGAAPMCGVQQLSNCTQNCEDLPRFAASLVQPVDLPLVLPKAVQSHLPRLPYLVCNQPPVRQKCYSLKLDTEVANILQEHLVYRRRLTQKQKVLTMVPTRLLTAAQFLRIKDVQLMLDLDVEQLKAVYECFLGRKAPPKSRKVLATILLAMQRELPTKMRAQEQFCNSVDIALGLMRFPLIEGLADAVKARNWYRLIDRTLDDRCKVVVSIMHMVLVPLGIFNFFIIVEACLSQF